MNLGDVIRVIEVPASDPVETVPARAPAPTPERVPLVPAGEPATVSRARVIVPEFPPQRASIR